MNQLQMSAQVTENTVGHQLELRLIYPDHSTALNAGLFFLYIRLMVLLHGKSCKGRLQRSRLKTSSKIKFCLSAIPIHSHGLLLSWKMLQFINQRYIMISDVTYRSWLEQICKEAGV